MNTFKICLLLAGMAVAMLPLHASNEHPTEESSWHISGDFDLQIKLYPNPFRNILEFDLGSNGSVQSVQIRFVNLIGKEMESKFNMPVNSMSEHFELDLKQLPSGVYFMEISARNATGTVQKFTRKVTKL
jgi:hypothetical protein